MNQMRKIREKKQHPRKQPTQPLMLRGQNIQNRAEAKLVTLDFEPLKGQQMLTWQQSNLLVCALWEYTETTQVIHQNRHWCLSGLLASQITNQILADCY